jgi:hypothetical protein
MTTSPVKSIVDEQVAEAEDRVQVRGFVQLTRNMLVSELQHPIKADWLKRRPMPKPTPCQ